MGVSFAPTKPDGRKYGKAGKWLSVHTLSGNSARSNSPVPEPPSEKVATVFHPTRHKSLSELTLNLHPVTSQQPSGFVAPRGHTFATNLQRIRKRPMLLRSCGILKAKKCEFCRRFWRRARGASQPVKSDTATVSHPVLFGPRGVDTSWNRVRVRAAQGNSLTCILQRS